MNPDELNVFDAQISVKMSKELKARLQKIVVKHGLPLPEILRRLGAAAADFYDEHGWFSFPAIIIPERFQNQEGATTTEAETPVSKSRVPSTKGRVKARDKLSARGLNKLGRDVSRGKDRLASLKAIGRDAHAL